MRLLLATPFWPPGIGGSTRLVVGLAEHLQSWGHEVTVVTYGVRQPDDPASLIRVPPQSVRGTSSLAFARAVWRALGTRKVERALAYVAYPHAVGVGAACRARRVPYSVLALGEDVSVCIGDSKKAALLRPALRSARSLLAISNFTARALESLAGRPVAVHAPGIDPDPYGAVEEARATALRRRLCVPDGRKLILTLARLEPRKGHDRIVAALPRLPEAHYLVVGKGDPEPLQRQAEAVGVADRLTIASFVPDADLPALFSACDVYAMVSRHEESSREVEGFGIVYLEAAAAGKPCLAGSHGGAPDAVADGETGFVVDPTDDAAILSALRRLLSDTALAARFGAAGRERVRERFLESRFYEAVAEALTC